MASGGPIGTPSQISSAMRSENWDDATVSTLPKLRSSNPIPPTSTAPPDSSSLPSAASLTRSSIFFSTVPAFSAALIASAPGIIGRAEMSTIGDASSSTFFLLSSGVRGVLGVVGHSTSKSGKNAIVSVGGFIGDDSESSSATAAAASFTAAAAAPPPRSRQLSIHSDDNVTLFFRLCAGGDTGGGGGGSSSSPPPAASPSGAAFWVGSAMVYICIAFPLITLCVAWLAGWAAVDGW